MLSDDDVKKHINENVRLSSHKEASTNNTKITITNKDASTAAVVPVPANVEYKVIEQTQLENNKIEITKTHDKNLNKTENKDLTVNKNMNTGDEFYDDKVESKW
jgi:uncharacterized Zn finger protein